MAGAGVVPRSSGGGSGIAEVEPAPVAVPGGQVEFVFGEHDDFGGAQSGVVDAAVERERRQLKHRAVTEVRQVQVSPALGRLLRKHIAEHGTAPDGRLFRGEGGGLLSDTIYGRIWDKARHAALTPAEAASPLAERPYDLRHARLTTWLNTTNDPAQVAEWAGNSVPVLLRVYARCLTDSEQTALRRLEQAEPNPDPDRQAE